MTAIGAGSMWWPLAAMAVVTFLVWVRLYMVRIPEMQRRRIDPQSVATSLSKAGRYEDVRASDNFINLFELPVMFYVGALAATQFALVDTATLVLAWGFVIGRTLHSLIQCSYNRVMHRFAVYSLSAICLWAMWGWMIVRAV